MPDETPFAHPVERELARLFDAHGIEWRYEPDTFVLSRDAEGRVIEAFTPDFHLPAIGAYLECTVMRQRHATRKNRKIREATRRFGLVVGVLYRGDILRLAREHGHAQLALAAGEHAAR